MKTNYFLKPAVIILLIIALTTGTAVACVDYHPTPPPMTVKVDSTWTQFEITVHQLNIFAGTTGDFCTCALSSYQNIFSLIYYVAFVDSGTNNPINGFAVWNANSNASSAWSAASPGPTWDGFVAAVVTNMTPGLPVELIIRANLPPGYLTYSDIDSAFTFGGNLATDQWDNTNNVLANTHNSISGLGNRTYQLVSPDFFTGVESIENKVSVNVFPNPFNTSATVVFNKLMVNAQLEIYNSFGQMVQEVNNISGFNVRVNRDNLPAGIYFIRLSHDNKIITSNKLIIAD